MFTKLLLNSLAGSSVAVAAGLGVGVPLSTTSTQQNGNIVLPEGAYAPETDTFSLQIKYSEVYDQNSLENYLQGKLGTVSDVISSFQTYLAGTYTNVTAVYVKGSSNYENSTFNLSATPTTGAAWDDNSSGSRTVVVTLTNLSKQDTSVTDPDEQTPGDDTEEDTPKDDYSGDTQEDTPKDDTSDDTQEDTPKDDTENGDVATEGEITPISNGKTWTNASGTTQLWTDNNGTVSGYSSNYGILVKSGKFVFYNGKVNTYRDVGGGANNVYWYAGTESKTMYVYNQMNMIKDKYIGQYAGAITIEMQSNNVTKVSWPGNLLNVSTTAITQIYDGYVVALSDVSFTINGQQVDIKTGGTMVVNDGNFVATSAYVTDTSSFSSVSKNKENVVTGTNENVVIDGDGTFLLSSGSLTLTDANNKQYYFSAVTGGFKRVTIEGSNVTVENYLTRVGASDGSDTFSWYKYDTKSYSNIISTKINSGYIITNKGYVKNYSMSKGLVVSNSYFTEYDGDLSFTYGTNKVKVSDGSILVNSDSSFIATSATVNPVEEVSENGKIWTNASGTTKLWTDDNGTVSGSSYGVNYGVLVQSGKFVFYNGKVNVHRYNVSTPNSYWYAGTQAKTAWTTNEWNQLQKTYIAQYAGAVTIEMQSSNITRVSWPGTLNKVSNTEYTQIYDGYIVAKTDVTFTIHGKEIKIKEGGTMVVNDGNFVATDATVVSTLDWVDNTTNNSQIVTGSNNDVIVSGDGSFLLGTGSLTLTDANNKTYTYSAPKGGFKRVSIEGSKVTVEGYLTRVGTANGSDSWGEYTVNSYSNITSVKINSGYVISNKGYYKAFTTYYKDNGANIHVKSESTFTESSGSISIKSGNKVIDINEGSLYVNSDSSFVATSATLK